MLPPVISAWDDCLANLHQALEGCQPLARPGHDSGGDRPSAWSLTIAVLIRLIPSPIRGDSELLLSQEKPENVPYEHVELVSMHRMRPAGDGVEFDVGVHPRQAFAEDGWHQG